MDDSSISSSKVGASAVAGGTHTPEPWSYSFEREDDRFRWEIWCRLYGIGLLHGPVDENEANARRIVACVNACSGLSTALLESKPLTDSQDGWLKTAVAMERQRDELAAALRDLIDDNNINPRDGNDVAAMLRYGKATELARALLAKVGT